MRTEHISLLPGSIGRQYELSILHFGNENAGQKIYIQAALHADELPGALVCYHLREQLLALEAANRLNAHIVLVPMANPIGSAQTLHHNISGRFDLATGRNYNRLTIDLHTLVQPILSEQANALASDAAANVRAIRQAMRQALAQYRPIDAVGILHHTLMQLAFDADVVLDLHCDHHAHMYLYTLSGLWPVIEPLARYSGSTCQLMADESPANGFDEALNMPWLKLQRDFPAANIPLACAAATLELRGQRDISHEHARQDSRAIIHYLIHRQAITADEHGIPALPELLAAPRLLTAVEGILAPVEGVVVFCVQPGQRVRAGDKVLDLVDPIRGTLTEVHCRNNGTVLCCNTNLPFAQTGAELLTLSGDCPLPGGAWVSP